MHARTVFSPRHFRLLISLVAISFLASCGQPPTQSQIPAPPNIPAPPSTRPIVSIPSGPVTAPAPKPIQLTKPPILGPLGPAIVLLPDRMAEPQIRVRLTDAEDRPPSIPRNKYRGHIEIVRLPKSAGVAGEKYIAVNTLPLDQYLQGVLAKELYGSWNPTTYRAQAIAARTFALFQMLTDGRTKLWDVNNDESSQMYGGIAGETAKAKAAVADTHGQVLFATTSAGDGRSGIFCARYSACIGGASQDPFDAWGDPSLPPLAAHFTGNVDDNCDKFTWDRDFTVSKADLTRCIQNWGRENNFPHLQSLASGRGGRIESVTISKHNPITRRPTEFLLTDSTGRTAPIRAEEFRLALLYDPQNKAPKPYSSSFDIRVQGDAFVMYNGHGYGHGIGMSQWGAQKLATQGQSHTQILAFFYPGSTLRQLW